MSSRSVWLSSPGADKDVPHRAVPHACRAPGLLRPDGWHASWPVRWAGLGLQGGGVEAAAEILPTSYLARHDAGFEFPSQFMPLSAGVRWRRLDLVVYEVGSITFDGCIYLTQVDGFAVCFKSHDLRQQRGEVLASGHGSNHRTGR